jgi:hypothetical protein
MSIRESLNTENQQMLVAGFSLRIMHSLVFFGHEMYFTFSVIKLFNFVLQSRKKKQLKQKAENNHNYNST